MDSDASASTGMGGSAFDVGTEVEELRRGVPVVNALGDTFRPAAAAPAADSGEPLATTPGRFPSTSVASIGDDNGGPDDARNVGTTTVPEGDGVFGAGNELVVANACVCDAVEVER